MQSELYRTIILASRSPRRQELLTQIDVPYVLLDVEIDETPQPNEVAQNYVTRMAMQKAQTAWLNPQCTQLKQAGHRALLAADTSVVLAEQILGKPNDLAHAADMLRLLSGATHHVISSVALINDEHLWLETSVTQVEFAELTESAIRNYCASGESMGKAGSYAIQGLAAQFVKSIRGSYSGVVGLPLYETRLLLDQHFKAQS